MEIDSCETRAQIIQVLLESGKSLVPDAAPSKRHATPKKALVSDAPPLSRDVKRRVQTPAFSVRSWESYDKKALMVVFRSCGGSRWRNRVNWGTDEPLRKWHGVEVNMEGRVVKLDLRENSLIGEHARGRLYFNGIGQE